MTKEYNHLEDRLTPEEYAALQSAIRTIIRVTLGKLEGSPPQPCMATVRFGIVDSVPMPLSATFSTID